MSRPEKVSIRILLCVGAGLIAGTGKPASAARSYDVEHKWWLTVAGGIPQNLTGTWRHFEHAWDLNVPASDWYPRAQPPNFSPYGVDYIWPGDNKHVYNRGENGMCYANEAVESISYGSGGHGVWAGSSVANTSWSIQQQGSMLAGSNRAWGAVGVANFGTMFAFSESKLNLKSGVADMRTGQLVWQPLWSDTASGTAAIDPIDVTITDADDIELLTDTLVDIEHKLHRGTSLDSTFGWKDGWLFADGVLDGTFSAVVESPYVPAAERGSALLKIENGIVTESEDSGIFAGLLPGVGTPGTFNVPFVNQITLDYSYPNIGENIAIELAGAGSAPEPATLSLLMLGGVALLRRRQ